MAARGRRLTEARHPRWTLGAAILASSLAFIDGSVVNVALPTIGQELGGSAADLQWTVNAYLLPLSALLLLGGAMGDAWGRRRVLIGGIALFALASIGCALAPTLALLLPLRGLQGVGAAMLMPNSLSVLGNAFEGRARGRAIGTWAAAGAIFGAIGPPIGGWLVEAAGWRWVFGVNLPVAAGAIVVAWRFVDPGRGGERALDWAGAAIATVALGLVTWAVTLWSAHGRIGVGESVCLALGVAALAAFVAVERRRGERAMMPLDLFGSRAFVGLTVLTLLLYGALGGLILLLPFTLIRGGGYTPLQAGLALLPFALFIGGGSRIAGRFTAEIGPRLPLSLGPTIAAGGFALLALLDPLGGYVRGVLPGLVVLSSGMALAVAPLTTAVIGAVDARHTGTASGFNSAMARTGGLIATAAAGGVMSRAGADLGTAFRIAASVGAVLALLSAAAALATLDKAAPAR